MRSKQKDHAGDYDRENQYHQQTRLIPLCYPFFLACPNILRRIARHCIGKVHIGHHGQSIDLSSRCISCNKYLAVRVYKPLHKHHANGYNGLLNHRRHPYFCDPFHCRHLKQPRLLPNEFGFIFHLLHPAHQNEKGKHRAHPLGNQCGPRHSRHTHMKTDNKKQIQYDIGQC